MQIGKTQGAEITLVSSSFISHRKHKNRYFVPSKSIFCIPHKSINVIEEMDESQNVKTRRLKSIKKSIENWIWYETKENTIPGLEPN